MKNKSSKWTKGQAWREGKESKRLEEGEDAGDDLAVRRCAVCEVKKERLQPPIRCNAAIL